jgi:Domain of unknown function (DUF6265)
MHVVRATLLVIVVLGAGAKHSAAQGSGAQRSAPARPFRVQEVGWLAGCWERSAGRRVVEEHWMRPRGGLMLGVGRTVDGDTLVEFEQVRLLERDGRLVYAAAPSGQPPAEFASAVVSDTAVVFENPAHDFPQRIIYRRLGTDSLVARIEGTRGGRLRGVDFPYRRAACQDPA